MKGEYKLLTYEENGRPIAGLLAKGRVYPLADMLDSEGIFTSSLLHVIENWQKLEPDIEAAVARADGTGGFELGTRKLLAPLLYPHTIYCAAANYRDHMKAMALKLKQAEEADPRETDAKPYHFVVSGRTCTSGPEDPIVMPPHGKNIDWEIELVAVIGRAAKNATVDEALHHVTGYMIGNDVSVRDLQYLKIPTAPIQSLFRSDFVAMKGFDQACVFGPWLVPAKFIADPQNLALKTWVDDELMQDSSTAQMVYSTAEQISYLSKRVTLLPGDVVMTGTPAGTGMETDRFLVSGETIRMSIEGIGEMSQRVIRN